MFYDLYFEKYNKTKLALNSSQNFKAMVLHIREFFPSFLHPLFPMRAQSELFIYLFIELSLKNKI